MTSSVSNTEKWQFIRWFLKHYQLKRREGVWILNFLLSSETLLSRVRFTDDVHYCPRAIVMSSVGTDGIPFRFYFGQMMTNDAEKAFYELRNHKEEPIYIQINFPTNASMEEYLAVVEANPYVPSSRPVRVLDQKIADLAIYESKLQFQKSLLLKLIDEALDEGNESMFHYYVSELKKLNNE